MIEIPSAPNIVVITGVPFAMLSSILIRTPEPDKIGESRIPSFEKK